MWPYTSEELDALTGPRGELGLIQIFLFSQPGNLDAHFKVRKFLLNQVPNLRVSHLLFVVTIQTGSHLFTFSLRVSLRFHFSC